jgi:hypothetical protein
MHRLAATVLAIGLLTSSGGAEALPRVPAPALGTDVVTVQRGWSDDDGWRVERRWRGERRWREEPPGWRGPGLRRGWRGRDVPPGQWRRMQRERTVVIEPRRRIERDWW